MPIENGKSSSSVALYVLQVISTVILGFMLHRLELALTSIDELRLDVAAIKVDMRGIKEQIGEDRSQIAQLRAGLVDLQLRQASFEAGADARPEPRGDRGRR